MPNIREIDLPGIGRKFQIETRGGERLIVIIHDDGRRELYRFDAEDPDDCTSVLTLDDDEARAVAGIIGGMTYTPKALESVEVAIDELVIDWIKVDPSSKWAGKSIGELQIRQKTGATIIAVIEKDQRQRVNPGPDQMIRAEATLVVTGDRHQVKVLKQMMTHGSSS